MADVHNKITRSYNMSQIKGKDTKPEMLVRRYLHNKGLRYGLHSKNLPGRPDLHFNKYNIALFINGCFWHGHENCKYFKLPNTRTEWWREKIKKTTERDKKKLEELKEKGWRCIVIWECDLKPKQRERTLEELYLSIVEKINSNYDITRDSFSDK